MQIKVFSLFTLLLTFAVSLPAETRLGSPLRFVSADSIVSLDLGRTNLHATALRIDKNLNPQNIAVNHDDYPELVRQWTEEILPELNLTGSLGEEFSPDAAFSASNTLYTAARLLALTGDARYAETMECATFNALLSAAHHPERPMQQHVAAQALLNAMGMAYAQSEEGIYINMFTNSLAHITHRGIRLRVDQITMMPFSPRVRLRIDLPRGEHKFTVFLRIPEWARRRYCPEGRYASAESRKEMYPVYINGKDFIKWEEKDGYLRIERSWSSGDEIFFDFPLSPERILNIEKGTMEKTAFALRLGALVYALPAQSSDTYFSINSPLRLISQMQGYEEVLAIAGTAFDAQNPPADAQAGPVPFTALPFAFLPPEEKNPQIWLE